ncbi:MAG: envelope integrity protein Cei [Nocardiaceae bacterium]|nr:envelope integrity protein Cei [Nocardiaceae bacterium]
MVSLITDGSANDRTGRPYKRRRVRPWGILVVCLSLLCVGVWISALTKQDTNRAPATCNSPGAANAQPGDPAPEKLGQRVGQDALEDVQPAALVSTKVRVFNGNGVRGQATHIASQLSDYGFNIAADGVGNDPVYTKQDLECTGQIRYGTKGKATASALQLLIPCAELISDSRSDDVVDVALGSYIGNDLSPNSDADEVLRTLKEATPGQAAPPLDSALLKAARSSDC